MPKFYNPYIGSIGRFFDGDPTLRGYWQLQGNSWDNSGNGNNGTDTSVVYNQPGFREGVGSAYFNGSAYVSQPLQSNNNSTWLFWMKYSTTSGIVGIHGPINGSGNYNDRFFATDSNNKPYARKDTISGGNVAFSPIPMNDGLWHHYAVVWANVTPGCVQLYIDGKLVSMDTKSTQFDPGVVGLYIGKTVSYSVANNWKDSYRFTGNICDFAVFNRVLSPAEISQYYNWAISNPKRNTLIIDPSLLYNPAISRRRLLLTR